MEFQEEIDLGEIFIILKNKWRLIALTTIIAILLGAIVSFFILSPTYESSTTLIVVQSQSRDSQDMYNDVRLSQQLVNTYGEIMKTGAVLGPVIQNENLDMTIEQLSQKIRVSPVNNTELLEVTVSDESPLLAANIANEIARVFTYEIQNIMRVDNVSTIEEAAPPDNPVSPNKTLNILISAVLGMMIGVFLIFLMEYLDKTMKKPEDIERHLGLPVLGSIPQVQE